jgi:malonyl-CoA O-methyltransferase
MPAAPTAGAAQPARVDRRQVRRAHARAASTYDQAAAIPREIALRLGELLDLCKLEPTRVLDLGCGTGADLAELRRRYPQAQIVGADLSPEMLAAGANAIRSERSLLSRLLPRLLPFLGQTPPLAAADAAALPFKDASFGLLWSNLALHWLGDPSAALREARRVLEVGGLLMFAVPGPDTLRELGDAFGDKDIHTQHFIDMHDWGDMLVGNGFSDPVMNMEMLTVTYADLDALVAELRALGATCAMADRRRGLMGRAGRERLIAAYDALRRDGRLPASLEIIYGHAWKAEAAPSPQTADGRSVIQFMPRPR